MPDTPNERILVVDDDKALRRMLQVVLCDKGYAVTAAASTEAAMRAALRAPPDLVLLDVVLPRGSGLDFMRQFRESSDAPVLLLSGKTRSEDKIEGLKRGADDYLCKPFSTAELIARVRSLLLRARPGQTAGRRGSMDLGRAQVDPQRRSVLVGARLVRLSPKEFDLLCAILEAGGRVVDRASLARRVWPDHAAKDLAPRTIDQYVARLRRKLAPEGGRLATVHGSGYRALLERPARSRRRRGSSPRSLAGTGR